jgi:ketosteroid isomerase-like protein
MRQVILFVAVLISTAISLNAQTAPDAAELTKLLNDFLAGAGRNDPAAHDRFWAADLIYTRSAGVRTNKEELMKGVRSVPLRKEGDPITVFTAEDIRIQQYGNAAVVAFKLVSTTTKADGTKTVGNNLNTGTFIKRDGKWQVVAWQSTTVPQPQPTTGSQTAAPAPKPVALSSESALTTSTRNYAKGPRGGCYYLNPSGSKVYVDKKFCP